MNVDFISQNIYNLKKEYSCTLILRKGGTETTDWDTGKATKNLRDITLTHAIALPEGITLFRRDISILEAEREILIDANDLNVKIDRINDTVVLDNKEWEITHLSEVGNQAYILVIKDLQGTK